MGNILFASNTSKKHETPHGTEEKWKIIIADDEESIHTITKMVTKNVSFKEKNIEFISVFSGEEAIEVLKQNPDTALILLDVVMESEDAGLVVAEKIRNELNNKNIRIILRTGQPGQAPENLVISKYDINDYKLKTEITSQNLCTAIMCSLRAYSELFYMEKTKIGLEIIVKIAEGIIFAGPEAIKQFSNGVLLQLSSLLHINSGNMEKAEGFCYLLSGQERKSLAFLGGIREDIPNTVIENENELLLHEKTIFKNDAFHGIIKLDSENSIIFFVKGSDIMKDIDHGLLTIFISNIKNIYITLFSKYYKKNQ